ncbi:MAG: ParB/RepB/Spo0J family partition protein [Gemmatimonadota bacterium]
MSADKPRRLGRGLEALMSAARPGLDETATTAPAPPLELYISRIAPNPFQPRREFDPTELAALENSLRTNGLLQPVTVRTTATGTYQLVAGERRLRAAARLGWTTIPATVREFDDQSMLVMALVENLQRADLNPLDEAAGYRRLQDEFHLSQQDVATAVGKDRSTVANLLRLLTLPEAVQRLVRDGRLSFGHARALLALPDERAIIETARRVIDEHLTVRDVERIAHEARTGVATAPRAQRTDAADTRRSLPPQDPEVRRLTEILRRRLQTDVRIALSSGDAGTVTLNFYSADDLQRLVELIIGHSADHA